MLGGGRDRSTWDEEASELLARFAERRARREGLRRGEDPRDIDWNLQPNGRLVLPVREGHVMALPDDPARGLWSSYMLWEGGYGHAFLARASRSEVERIARRIQQHGPSRGPDLCEQPGTWRRFDDDTEHASIEEGELRLMQPIAFDDSLLILARSDKHDSVAVLGVHEHEELRENAEALGSRAGRSLRLRIGGQPRYLQALGACGIVGYLEHGDDLFVLGHLGGGEFGLAWQSGDVQRGLRRYTLREVMRGDLGPVLDWAHRPASGAPSARAASARREDRPKAASRRAAPTKCSRLAGLELMSALDHLTPCKSWLGVASTVVPLLLDAIRALVQLSLGNETLWAKDLLPFIRKHTKQSIFCCRKILNAALRIIARRTKLLVRRGRRWLFRLGDLRVRDSNLLKWMIWRGPLDSDLDPRRRASREHHAKSAQARGAPSPATTPTTTAAPGASGAPRDTDAATPAATEPNTPTMASPSTPAATEPNTSITASPSPPADVETPAAPEPASAVGSSSTPADDKTPSAGEESTSPAADVAPPAGRSSTTDSSSTTSASTRPGSHAAAASGPSPASPYNNLPLPPEVAQWMQTLAALSPEDNPAALAPWLPRWMKSFASFQAWLKKTLQSGARRSERGPGETFRGLPSWTDEEELGDLFPSGPRAPRGPSGKRRDRPP